MVLLYFGRRASVEEPENRYVLTVYFRKAPHVKLATARAARCIRARHKLILTGTPIQNRVQELWATFDFLSPNFLGTSKAFQRNFANPIAKSQLPGASAQAIADGMVKLKLLHQQVLPFILRREKDHVLTELPPKTLTIVRVPMSNIQASAYHSFGIAKSATLRSMEDAIGNAKVDETGAVPFFSRDVLKSLLFLRLLCTHPTLVLSPDQRETVPESWKTFRASGKMQALAELLSEAGIYESDLAGADRDESFLYIDDSIGDDAKIEDDEFLQSTESSTGTLVSNIAAQPDKPKSKCLIFSQFTKSLDAVEEFLFQSHMSDLKYVRLDGTVSASKRMDVVDRFNKDASIAVMLLTTRAGGLGLNLTAANIVIFLESDYNPFADIQAIDRTRRIGQTKVVHVYRIVTCESIEEQILRLQEKKIAVSNAVVNTENSSMFSMGTDRLLDIVVGRDEQDNAAKIEFDLEGLLERCSEDYKSLSVKSFSNRHGGELP